MERLLGHVTNPSIRAGVRHALMTHLGLDIPAARDGASSNVV
jgi:hypothetical protein